RTWNTAQPFIKPRSGETPLFDQAMAQCFAPDDASRLLDFWADMFQDPLHPPGLIIVLLGKSLSGKSRLPASIGRTLGSLFLRDLPARDRLSKFNALVKGRLFVHVDEMSAATNRHIEDIAKLLATAEKIYIEHKGIDKIAVDNLVRLLITSEHDPIAL